MNTQTPRRPRGFWDFVACAGIVFLSSCSGAGPPGSLVSPASEQSAASRQGSERKQSDGFPNILLQTQDGKQVRFYDDLVKNKAVLVNFIYTSCQQSCSPTTANLAKVHKLLGDRVGQDLIFLSISLDPAVDRPTILKEYAARFGQFNGWYFLTGKESEIEQLRRAMGLYDLDPDRDADKTQHAGIVIAGNDKTNRWASLPALMDHRQIAQTVLRITRNRETLDVKG